MSKNVLEDPSLRTSRAELTGVLADAPYFGRTKHGDTYARMVLEVSETFTDRSNNQRTVTQDHAVVAFGARADALITENLRKGDQIAVEGDLRSGSYKTGRGDAVRTTEVHLTKFAPSDLGELSKNSVALYGTVREEPRVAQVNGTTFVNISLAVPTRDAQGAFTSHADWHHVSLAGKPAEAAARMLRQGDFVTMSGSVSNRTVERDGASKHFTEVRAFSFQILAREQTLEREKPAQEKGMGLG